MKYCADTIIFRIRTANVLLIGMKALANEVVKNLVLAGIGSMTVWDNGIVTDDDLGAQFFISEQHIGLNVSFVSNSFVTCFY